MDLSRSSPFADSPFPDSPLNLRMGTPHSDHPYNGIQLDPVIHYNPEESKRDSGYKNMHRRKIFGPKVVRAYSSLVEEAFAVPLQSEPNQKEVISKLSHIEDRVSEIGQTVTRRQQKDAELVEKVHAMVSEHQKDVRNNKDQIQRTEERIAKLGLEKNNYTEQITTLKTALVQSTRRQREIQAQTKHKDHLLRQGMQLEMLNALKDRSTQEYERIKAFTTRRQDCSRILQGIRRRVRAQRQPKYQLDKSIQSENPSLKQFRSFKSVIAPKAKEYLQVKPTHRKTPQRDVIPQRGPLSPQMHSFQEPDMGPHQSKLHITQSQAYPFQQVEKMILV